MLNIPNMHVVSTPKNMGKMYSSKYFFFKKTFYLYVTLSKICKDEIQQSNFKYV